LRGGASPAERVATNEVGAQGETSPSFIILEKFKMESALYLIPVTLGETEISQVLPSYNHDIIVGIKHFIVENIRSARRFLKKVEKSIDIDTLTFYELNRHTDRKFIGEYLEPLKRDSLLE